MIRLALKQAKESNYLYKLGVVITKGHRVLSTGYNKIAHCDLNIYKDSRHAEMHAIQKVLRQPDGLRKLANAIIYVTRITKSGTGMARPCSRCMELIKSVGIKTIIYTTDTGCIKEKVQ